MGLGKTTRVWLICIFLALGGDAGAAHAGYVVVAQPMSFGNIVGDPDGDLIEINAAAGPAVPQVYGSGSSFINGGNSGLIRVFSDTVGETITLIFPASVPVNGGGATHTLEGLATRSTATPVISSSTGILEFDIGGLLRLQSGQPDNSYTFDITVTVQFDNP